MLDYSTNCSFSMTLKVKHIKHIDLQAKVHFKSKCMVYAQLCIRARLRSGVRSYIIPLYTLPELKDESEPLHSDRCLFIELIPKNQS